MDAIETIEYKGYTIEICPDMDPESPRKWDNFCEIHACHTRYNLGDGEFNYDLRNDYDKNRFNEMKREAKKNKDIVLSLYAYEHGNIALSLSNNFYPFNCRWDSGQVGYMVIRRKKALEDMIPESKIFHPALKKRCLRIAESEIETYNQYFCGNVYGYNVIDKNDDEVDSCCGYYGTEDAITEAKSIVDYRTQKVEV